MSREETAHVDQSRFCVIDTETTGLDVRRDEIVAFACIPMVAGRIVLRELRYTLIKPAAYRLDAMKFHGIGLENLATAAPFQDQARSLLGALNGILVGYAVEFDYLVLQRHFKSAGISFKADWVDIVAIERCLRCRRRCEDEDFSFEALLAAYGLRPHFRHNACADAFFAAQIFQLQLSALRACGVHSTKQALKIAHQYRHGDASVAF